MTNRFVDNSQLIDVNEEDDNLLIMFHSLEDVQVSDNDQRKQSLGWDCGFFTSAGLLNPEELSRVNKGFKKSNPSTQKDAKRSTKIGSCNSQDSKRSRSGGLPKSTCCFTSPTIRKTVHHLNESFSSSKQRMLISSNAKIRTASFFDGSKGKIKSNLSPCFSTGNSLKVGKVGSSCSKLKPNTGLLSPKKLFMVNKDMKKSNCSTPKDALSCKKMNNAAQDCKRLQSAGLPKSTCFASPTVLKTVHCSYESSSSKNLSKPIKMKVNSKNMKLVNSPSSVLRFPLSPASTSPASSIDGDLRLSGLLSTEELFMINKGLKKSNPTVPENAIRSKVTTKTDGSKSNGAQDYKPDGLPNVTCFTSPTIQKTIHRSCESSSKSVLKSVKRKVNSKNMKLVNSPSSVHHFPLSFSSTSPASSIEGDSLSSTHVKCQDTIPVLKMQSQNYEERKFISQAALKPSGLRMPSPRIGFFDMEPPGSIQDCFRYIEKQLQASNLSPVSTRNCLKVGNVPFIEDNRVNLSGPIRERLAHWTGPFQEYRRHRSFGKQYVII